MVVTIGCGALRTIHVPATPPPPEQLSQLWVDPGDTPRDLFWGIGGEQLAPPREAPYELIARDDRGFSTSFDVKGPDGVEWSAKIGPEAQTEVVVSRLLWGLGYHQPPIYYLPSWNLALPKGESKRESEARFRPKLPQLKVAKEPWRWADNALLGAREFRGLLVTLLMFNSTDLKNDNNSIYTFEQSMEGAPRWFVVRDLGAALGETGKMYPRRNCLECFEQHGFITAIEGQHVEFDYVGRHQELISMIRPSDVRWAGQLMAKLTDKQWHDAFRAANYSTADAERYIARMKQKIDDALALRARPVDQATH